MFQESGSDWCWKSVPGIVSFSNMRQKPCILQALVIQSCWTLCNPMDCSHQAPLFMGFSRQEYWNGLPCPPPGDLPDSGIKPMSLTSPALAGEFFTTSCTWATLWPNNEGGLSDWTIYWATYSCKTSWSQETQKSIFFFRAGYQYFPCSCVSFQEMHLQNG